MERFSISAGMKYLKALGPSPRNHLLGPGLSLNAQHNGPGGRHLESRKLRERKILQTKDKPFKVYISELQEE